MSWWHCTRMIRSATLTALIAIGSADAALAQGSRRVADFNGDGITDLAIGIPLEDVDGVLDAGATAVLFGTASGLSATVNHFLVASTRQAGALFGASHTAFIVNTPF